MTWFWVFMHPLLIQKSSNLVRYAKEIEAEQEKTKPLDTSKSTCKCGFKKEDTR